MSTEINGFICHICLRRKDKKDLAYMDTEINICISCMDDSINPENETVRIQRLNYKLRMNDECGKFGKRY